jgi:hypothetical protein
MSENAVPDELQALAPVGSDERRRLFLKSLIDHLWPRCTWLFGQLDVGLSEPPDDLGFMTADHPFGLWTDRPDDIARIGLLTARLVVHPVSPRHALWFKKRMDPWPAWF